jgi:hypothetical protein
VFHFVPTLISQKNILSINVFLTCIPKEYIEHECVSFFPTLISQKNILSINVFFNLHPERIY